MAGSRTLDHDGPHPFECLFQRRGAPAPAQTKQKSPHGGTASGARSLNVPLSQSSGRWKLILLSPKWTEQIRLLSPKWTEQIHYLETQPAVEGDHRRRVPHRHRDMIETDQVG